MGTKLPLFQVASIFKLMFLNGLRKATLIDLVNLFGVKSPRQTQWLSWKSYEIRALRICRLYITLTLAPWLHPVGFITWLMYCVSCPNFCINFISFVHMCRFSGKNLTMFICANFIHICVVLGGNTCSSVPALYILLWKRDRNIVWRS